MKLSPPQGELKFWSILWMLFGLLAVYLGLTQKMSVYLVLGPLIGLSSLGLWFRSKLCGYVLLVTIALGILLGIVLLITKEFRWLKLARIGLSCYFVFLLANWLREFDVVERMKSEARLQRTEDRG